MLIYTHNLTKCKGVIKNLRVWLKNIRLMNNETQLSLANKLDISESYYNMIENGERKKDLDLSMVVKLAELFNVSVEWIAEQEKANKVM